ncbi:type II toxin-antitoxin system ParD family antitoxin [Wenzhouxiangella sp. EGI_FJ10305]|uniref:type II toxin-antitoxin system ParD family antitoxin n=1 Tax=Wenzhouxiangella sp. EGI_FJ10305 TaxID=3243768 RepID=UPI0035E370B1
MTMHINLSPEMEGFIKNLVKTGEYGNATEVIRDAIRRLKAQEMHKAAWRQAIELGDTDPESDTPYTATTARELAQKAQQSPADSASIDPELMP